MTGNSVKKYTFHLLSGNLFKNRVCEYEREERSAGVQTRIANSVGVQGRGGSEACGLRAS